jgi:hypothetical protein
MAEIVRYGESTPSATRVDAQRIHGGASPDLDLLSVPSGEVRNSARALRPRSSPSGARTAEAADVGSREGAMWLRRPSARACMAVAPRWGRSRRCPGGEAAQRKGAAPRRGSSSASLGQWCPPMRGQQPHVRSPTAATLATVPMATLARELRPSCGVLRQHWGPARALVSRQASNPRAAVQRPPSVWMLAAPLVVLDFFSFFSFFFLLLLVIIEGLKLLKHAIFSPICNCCLCLYNMYLVGWI